MRRKIAAVGKRQFLKHGFFDITPPAGLKTYFTELCVLVLQKDRFTAESAESAEFLFIKKPFVLRRPRKGFNRDGQFDNVTLAANVVQLEE
jgi:hypothetical protein